MPKLHLAHHAVTVSDLESSVAFYRDFMHMQLEHDVHHVSGEGIERGTGLPGAHLGVARLGFQDHLGVYHLELIQYLFPEGKKQFGERLCDVGASCIGIHVDNVQKTYHELHSSGANFISPPARLVSESPHYVTFMLDPDGYRIKLTSFASHHEYVVSDMGRSVAFYRDVLGLEVAKTCALVGKEVAKATGLPEAHIRATYMVLPGGKWGDEYIGLHHYARPQGKRRHELRLCDVGCFHLAIGVADVRQAYQEFLAKGAQFIAPPIEGHPGSKRVFTYMLDPDGYVIELCLSDAE